MYLYAVLDSFTENTESIATKQMYAKWPQKTTNCECPGNYRFGFNGKEKLDEITGVTGATYDYGFRIYDARIGKFLSVDPLFRSYPWYTTYQFAGNNPIWAIDLDGLEEQKMFIPPIKTKKPNPKAGSLNVVSSTWARIKHIQWAKNNPNAENPETGERVFLCENTHSANSAKSFYYIQKPVYVDEKFIDFEEEETEEWKDAGSEDFGVTNHELDMYAGTNEAPKELKDFMSNDEIKPVKIEAEVEGEYSSDELTKMAGDVNKMLKASGTNNKVKEVSNPESEKIGYDSAQILIKVKYQKKEKVVVKKEVEKTKTVKTY